MAHRWREDEKANVQHCFDLETDRDEKVSKGDKALCGWGYDGVEAGGMRTPYELRIQGREVAICHACHLTWDRPRQHPG
jgi:hypothetical protein